MGEKIIKALEDIMCPENARRALAALRRAGYAVVPVDKLTSYLAAGDYDTIETAKADIRAILVADKGRC